jgi:lon-related putative ATP-dependent protease
METLSPDQLRRTCEPSAFSFELTTELPDDLEVIGQERATRAIAFGLEIDSPGYNIFVLGPEGTGRTTTIQRFLSQKAECEPAPGDWVYVNNFHQDRHPRAIRLPTSMGARFQADMKQLIAELRRNIPRAFEGEAYQTAHQRIERELRDAQSDLMDELDATARERNFTVVQSPSGLTLVPLRDGHPMPPEMIEELSAEEAADYETAYRALHDEMAETLHRLRQQEVRTRQAMQSLDREVVTHAVRPLVTELKERYAEQSEVGEYLAEVEADVVDRAEDFRRAPDGPDSIKRPFKRYRVNLLVDNSRQEGAPVVVEPNPSYQNLIGRIEHDVRRGTPLTDFTMLTAGALHRANGGYLVVRAKDLLGDRQAWHALRQALSQTEIRLEEPDVPSVTVTTLTPEPIPLDVKVILVGNPKLYYYLYGSDADFRKLFKVKADFSTDMARTPENEHRYALFIRARSAAEDLLPFDRTGVARVVEYGSRLAVDQERLSTRFGLVTDLLREASYWAGEAGRDRVTEEDVAQAVAEQIYRAGRVEEEVQRAIAEEKVLITTRGEAMGQVNGLALNTAGDHVFGRPTRITARTFAGRSGVTNIQREVKLSAPTHGKGVLTLAGYLGGKYAPKRPLTLSASISLEQIYDEVRGDSASLAELYALLSSLAQLPIRQGIAVTGSVDQWGQVQPVGGVNQKIEGFHKACKARGLTGDQGVIIPRPNRRNLMLSEDVVEDVAEGRFHVHTVSAVDEGIELLTGTPAGEQDADGEYPEDTIHGRVARRLKELAKGVKKGRHSSGRASGKEEAKAAEEASSETVEEG